MIANIGKESEEWGKRLPFPADTIAGNMIDSTINPKFVTRAFW